MPAAAGPEADASCRRLTFRRSVPGSNTRIKALRTETPKRGAAPLCRTREPCDCADLDCAEGALAGSGSLERHEGCKTEFAHGAPSGRALDPGRAGDRLRGDRGDQRYAELSGRHSPVAIPVGRPQVPRKPRRERSVARGGTRRRRRGQRRVEALRGAPAPCRGNRHGRARRSRGTRDRDGASGRGHRCRGQLECDPQARTHRLHRQRRRDPALSASWVRERGNATRLRVQSGPLRRCDRHGPDPAFRCRRGSS